MRHKKFWLLLALVGCTGKVSDNRLSISKLPVELIPSDLRVGEQTGFADELGAILTDADGKALRLRVDGTRAPLESHPGNASAAGSVRALFPAGPFSALVAADNGLYLAQSGWLIQPTWREAMSPEGVRAATLAADGIAWIGHENGLYRMAGGELAELKVGDRSIADVSALAAAPAPDGSPAVWFVQDQSLHYAKQVGRARFEVSDAPSADELLSSGVLAMVSVSASAKSPGELWILTNDGLVRHDAGGFLEFAAPDEPRSLVAGGRYLWLHAGEQLYRYDADASTWGKLTFDAPRADLTLLAADAAGSAWLRSSEGETFQVRTGPVARVSGLFESASVYTTDVTVRARFLARETPERVTFALDGQDTSEQEPAQALASKTGTENLEFALGGFDASGREKSYSLAGLSNGVHTLTVRAQFGERELTRALHFDFRAGSGAAVSFAKDVLPIFEARCQKCHDSGPAHTLNTYELWVGEKDKIAAAVTELRMPADGPLDPAQIRLLQRWAAGGSAP